MSFVLGLTLPQKMWTIMIFETKLYSKATSADALNISGVEIAAGRFLRSDVINTTDFGINVRNNAGISIGTDGNF
jgi:hypothetical protein